MGFRLAGLPAWFSESCAGLFCCWLSHHDGSHSYSYDAENHMIQVDGGNTTTYTYDANGRRVEKTHNYTYSSMGVSDYHYDLRGHLFFTAWENPNGSGSCCNWDLYFGDRHLFLNPGARFSHTDWLGTERMRISTQGFGDHCASLPFGDALSCARDPDRYESILHFTGQQHDFESGLDNFGARYYSSQTGRFGSPDPGNAGANDSDPQSWNAYSYVRNNPVILTDPSGKMYCRVVKKAATTEDGDEIGDCISDAQYDADPKQYEDMDYNAYGCGCDAEMDKEYRQQQMGKLDPGVGDALYNAGTGANTIAAPAFWITMGFVNTAGLGMLDAALASSAVGLTTERPDLVIGKKDDLENLGNDERTLMDRNQMPNRGSYKANAAQNAGRLRFEMGKGLPIRDASAGLPGSETGFLRLERDVLRNHGWTLQADGYWYPPGK